MRDETDTPAYTCVEADGRFEVRAESGKCMVVTADRHNAEHYATLLNEAWRSGFRQGYRDARRG
ncbi:MAG: hypothetical protein AAFN78_11920 [Pseudomonadota bacterium]